MVTSGFKEDISEVSGHRKVALFEELVLGQTRPPTKDPPSSHLPAEDKGAVTGPVIRAMRAVRENRAAKLGADHHNDIVHLLAQVLVEGPESGTQGREVHGICGHLAGMRIEVALPAYEDAARADLGPDQLGCLPKRTAEARVRIRGSVRRLPSRPLCPSSASIRRARPIRR